jgi:uncharacterized coiled-coil DUF342 family protein
MDTDYLTQMAYDCLIYANDATDVLKSELGAACKEFKTEDEYLAAILDHVTEIEEDPEDYLDWWNLLDQTDIKAFKKKIQRLKKHIQETMQTPLKDRGKPRW